MAAGTYSRANASLPDSHKELNSKGRGIAVLVNNRKEIHGQATVQRHLCIQDVELLAESFWSCCPLRDVTSNPCERCV